MAGCLAALCLVLAAPAWAAAPKAKAPAPAPPEDPDVAKAGKVIDIDSAGNSKVVKGKSFEPTAENDAVDAPAVESASEAPAAAEPEPGAGAGAGAEKLKPGEISIAESCRLRVTAQCGWVARCIAAGTELPISCEELITACDGAPEGKAPYTRKAVEACAKGIKALKCGKVELTDPASLSPELKVAACKPLLDKDRGEVRKAGASSKAPGGANLLNVNDFDIGSALSGE